MYILFLIESTKSNVSTSTIQFNVECSTARKLTDVCNEYQVSMKLKPHIMVGIKKGNITVIYSMLQKTIVLCT